MLKKEDQIKYLRDVTSPPNQAGKQGDIKTVGVDIDEYSANYLFNSPAKYIKKIEKGASSNAGKRADSTANNAGDPGKDSGEKK